VGNVKVREERLDEIAHRAAAEFELRSLEASRLGRLESRSVADVRKDVANAGARQWLVEGLIIHGQHGVNGGPWKAGKGWDGLDLAVSVASATPWLNHFNVPTAGEVLVYCGEEDEYEIARRVEAIAAARSLSADLLPIRLVFAIPRLGITEDLDELARELDAHRPRLVILDPLYRGTGGADFRSLYAMGELLAGLEERTRSAGATLLAVTHFNRGEGKGAERFTGAGPAEWGRFLIAADVKARRPHPRGGEEVTRRFEVTGMSIPLTNFTLRRHVYALDSTDLESPLIYEAEVIRDPSKDGAPSLSWAQRRVLEVLEGPNHPMLVRQIGDGVANDGTIDKSTGEPLGLKHRTINDALTKLAEMGLADGTDSTPGGAREWWKT
jgi:hypothetical protein